MLKIKNRKRFFQKKTLPQMFVWVKNTPFGYYQALRACYQHSWGMSLISSVLLDLKYCSPVPKCREDGLIPFLDKCHHLCYFIKLQFYKFLTYNTSHKLRPIPLPSIINVVCKYLRQFLGASFGVASLAISCSIEQDEMARFISATWTIPEFP